MCLKSVRHSSLTQCSDQRHADTLANDRRRKTSTNDASFYNTTKVTPEMQKLFDVSRHSGWNNYLKFDAVELCPREDAEHTFWTSLSPQARACSKTWVFLRRVHTSSLLRSLQYVNAAAFRDICERNMVSTSWR